MFADKAVVVAGGEERPRRGCWLRGDKRRPGLGGGREGEVCELGK